MEEKTVLKSILGQTLKATQILDKSLTTFTEIDSGKSFFSTQIFTSLKPDQNLKQEKDNSSTSKEVNGIEENVKTSSVIFKKLGAALQQSQTALPHIEEGYNAANQGLEQTQGAINNFSSAWSNAATELNSGKSFFSVLKSTGPQFAQSFEQAKAGVSSLGQAFKSGKESFAILSGKQQKDETETTTPENPEDSKSRKKSKSNDASKAKNLIDKGKNNEVCQCIGELFKKGKGKKNKKPKDKKLKEQEKPDSQKQEPLQDEENTNVFTKLGAIFEQGEKTAETLQEAYQSGTQGLAQAQEAAGFFNSAWKQASTELQNGKGFFTVLQNASPLIGQGLEKAQESFVTLGQTFSLVKNGIGEIQSLRSSIGDLFSDTTEFADTLEISGEDKGNKQKNKKPPSTNQKSKTKSRLGGIRKAGGKVLGSSMAGLRKGMVLVNSLGSSMIGLVRGAIPAVITGIRTMGIALMTNPIGLIIGGIALAAGLVIRYWEPIKNFFGGLWGNVSGIFTNTWDTIKNLFSNFTPLGLLIKHWQPLQDFFGGLMDSIKNIFGSAWEWIKTSFIKPFESLKNTLGKVWQWVSGEGDEKDKSEVDTSENIKKTTPGKIISLNNYQKQGKLKPAAVALSTSLAAGAGTNIAAAPLAVNSVQPYSTLSNSTQGNSTQGTTLSHASELGAKQINNETHYHINVQASPGMDERQLAALIRQEIENKERRSQADQRRVLHDY